MKKYLCIDNKTGQGVDRYGYSRPDFYVCEAALTHVFNGSVTHHRNNNNNLDPDYTFYELDIEALTVKKVRP